MEVSAAKLLALIAAGESETVEFKESFNEDSIEAIGAFSNAKGGTLIVGVKDSGETCGVQIGKKTLEDIANRIQQATDPRIQPSFSIISLENKKVLIVSIAARTGAPVSVRGRYFRRTGRTNQRMSHDEIMQRMVASTGLSWDAVLEPTATIEDMDSDSISRFIQAVKKLGRQPIPEYASDQELLRKMGFIQDGTPTRAALLLFGKNPESFFASAFLKMGRFRSPTVIVDDREVHGALIDQLDSAMAWFRERLETQFTIQGKPERDVHWEYPLPAVREALVNALCHRDYSSLAHSQIRLYDDHLEIWNAGDLPSSLTPALLLGEHDSMPRNRKIAEAFFYAGFIERWGSGTIRMAEELKVAGLPPPEFESEAGRFRVIFYKQPLADVRLKKMQLSPRQSQAIAYVQEHGSISNAEYQSLTGISKRTATRELNELKLKNILIQEGTRGRGIVYRFKEP